VEFKYQTNKLRGPLVRERTIPTERPSLMDEILVPTFVDRGVSRSQRGRSPTVVNLSFLDRSRYFSEVKYPMTLNLVYFTSM
jgi:hypothetical protein